MTASSSLNVAFLGLGAMGARMAHNLLRAGHAVTVWNRSAAAAEPLVAAGARLASTPREAATGRQVVLSMLTDDAASRAVWQEGADAALEGLGEGALAIESSTLTPARARELGEAVAERGAHFLDAPVVGSRPQAEAGQLIFLVGGEVKTLEAAGSVLEPLAGAVHALGPVGSGMTLKLAINAFFGMQVTALGEILGLAGRGGIAPERTAEIVGSLPITGPALTGVLGQMTAGRFDPLFPVDLVSKDLAYAIQEGQAHGLPTPGSQAAREVFEEVKRRGHGGENLSAAVRVFL